MCVHRLSPAMHVLSIISGGLMAFAGAVGAIDYNPFVILQGLFLALLGVVVIGSELQWQPVLRQAPFLSHYLWRGVFFIYIATPLLKDGWEDYKYCILFWARSADKTCPTNAGGAGGGLCVGPLSRRT